MKSAKMERILVIDDDVELCTLVGEYLQAEGFIVESVHDGESGLQRATGGGYLLVVLDVMLPGINGFEVLRRLKDSPSTAAVPVIVLTTTDDPREIERCYELGCNVYITKPVEYDAFIEAVRRLGFFLQVVKLPPGQRLMAS